jgi:hypothetical protein
MCFLCIGSRSYKYLWKRIFYPYPKQRREKFCKFQKGQSISTYTNTVQSVSTSRTSQKWKNLLRTRRFINMTGDGLWLSGSENYSLTKTAITINVWQRERISRKPRHLSNFTCVIPWNLLIFFSVYGWICEQYKLSGCQAISQNWKKRLLLSSCLFVRMENLGFTGRIFMKYGIWGLFRNLQEKFNYS